MSSYENDIIAWSIEQAAFIRAGRWDRLDLEHLADEIEDVGKSEARELASRMAVLINHLLKWQYQPAYRCASWQTTIIEQRRMIDRRLIKTPSLKSFYLAEDRLADAYADGMLQAQRETGLVCFPADCPWAFELIVDAKFWPG